MAERLNNTIETQINDGNTIVSQIVDNNQPLQTVIQDVPQVQTVLQNGINVSSQINAPFVEVTSVNGKTGDVITEPVVGVFEPNHYYLKNTMIAYNNNLYYAKETFTSGSSFNANDWHSVEGSQITVDSALSSTSENPVQNKVITNALNGKNKAIYTAYNVAPTEDTPEAWKTTLGNNGVYITWYNTTKTFTNQPVQYGFMRTIIGANDIRQDFWVQTSGVHYARTGNYQGWSSYAGTTGVFKNLGAQPGNGTLTIQRNGTNIQTFTANQSGNATANISVPTKTSEITNDSGFISEDDLYSEVCGSGTTITFQDAPDNAPLSDFKLKGETSQNGTPTPDAPIPVQTVTGENVVKICGKNLFDSSKIIVGDVQNANTTIRLHSSQILWLEAGTYTFSTNLPTPLRYSISTTDSGYPPYAVWPTWDYNSGWQDSARTTTFTLAKGGYFNIQLSKPNNATLTLDEFAGYNYQLELGSSASSFGPYQGQSYEINLGKNLFDGANANAKTGYILNDSGTEVSDNTGGYTRNYSAVEPNTTYTLSGMAGAGTRRIYFYNGGKTFLSRTSGYSGAQKITFTTPANCYFVNVQIYTNTDTSSAMASWQLEQGSTATDYAPYFVPIELCKIGDYQDYIYKSGGKWYVRKAINKVTVDGSAGGLNSNNNWYFYSLLSLPAPVNSGGIMSSYFTGSTRAYMQNNKTVNGLAAISTNTDIIFRNTSYSSAADYKTWLAANTPTFYYQLATPTDTEITNEALVAQLEAILSQGSTYAGTNNITTVITAGNAQGELEICYTKSLLLIPTASASTLGGIKVGDGLDIASAGLLSTKLQFTDGDTLEDAKIITLNDGDTTAYPVTTKEAVLGLDDKFDASFLNDCIYDSTAFTQEQAEALKDAILADKEILIYEVNQSTNKALFRPHYVSASEDTAMKSISVQLINQAPARVMFNFMSVNGADWTLTVRTTAL